MNTENSYYSNVSTIPQFYFGEKPQKSPRYEQPIVATVPLFRKAELASDVTELDSRDTSFEDRLWTELETTEPWIPDYTEDESERTAAQEFIVEATLAIDDAYVDRSSLDHFIEQADSSLAKVGIESTEELSDVAHFARYMAFYLIGLNFDEYSRSVENRSNKRTLGESDWLTIVERSIARIDTDEKLTKEIYTCLPLFTHDEDERHAAVAVMALTFAEIEYWDEHPGVFGEIDDYTPSQMKATFDEIIATSIHRSSRYSKRVRRLEEEMNELTSSSSSTTSEG